MPNFSLEDQYSGLVAGVDEVGRGPWAGPVVSTAVILNRAHMSIELIKMIDDSKALSAKKRETIFNILIDSSTKNLLAYGIGEASVQEIDKINIRQATFLAMKRAIKNLGIIPDTVLIDGNATPDISIPCLSVIKGDSLSLSIAAASIIAKVTRDRLMIKLAQTYPDYGWESNAGYGTKAHQKGLRHHGVTPHHRHSYAPIRRLVQSLKHGE